MIAAALPWSEPEAAPRVDLACAGAAQVNHRGEVLLVLQRRAGDSLVPECRRHAAVQIRCGELHSAPRCEAAVEAVEPAGAGWAQIVRLIQAIALRRGEGRVGNLVHADGAR